MSTGKCSPRILRSVGNRLGHREGIDVFSTRRKQVDRFTSRSFAGVVERYTRTLQKRMPHGLGVRVSPPAQIRAIKTFSGGKGENAYTRDILMDYRGPTSPNEDPRLTSMMPRVWSTPTLALHTKASDMKREGKKVLSLAVGESMFDTPHNIQEAAIRAIRGGETRYTPVDGTPEAKEAVINLAEEITKYKISGEELYCHHAEHNKS